MNLIQSANRLFSFFCVSSVWISLVSAFAPVLLCKIGGLPLDPVACLAVFLTTFAVYSFDKVSGSKEDLLNTLERAILAKYPIKKLAALSYLLAIILIAATDVWRLPSVLVFGLSGLLYTARISGVRPKDVPGAKNLIVAGSTAVCYVGLIGGSWALYVLAFLVIFIDTVLFDMRDIIGDRAAGVRTLPVIIGRVYTQMILILANIIVYAFSPVAALYGVFLIAYFRRERHSLRYDLLVDAWMMWTVFMLLIMERPQIPFF
jgi:4-hydroxybenzoate polyprenyltransferase